MVTEAGISMNSNSQQAIRHWTLAQPAISAYVTATVRDFRERDDILQNIAVAVLESFDSYDPMRPFIGWALGIAKNQIGTYYRNRHKSALLLDPEALEQLGTAIEQLEDENSHSLDYLHECIKKLEKKALQICELRYENDLKPAAIAKLVGMTPNAVAKALQRIRDQLRLCVERQSAADGARL